MVPTATTPRMLVASATRASRSTGPVSEIVQALLMLAGFSCSWVRLTSSFMLLRPWVLCRVLKYMLQAWIAPRGALLARRSLMLDAIRIVFLSVARRSSLVPMPACKTIVTSISDWTLCTCGVRVWRRRATHREPGHGRHLL